MISHNQPGKRKKKLLQYPVKYEDDEKICVVFSNILILQTRSTQALINMCTSSHKHLFSTIYSSPALFPWQCLDYSIFICGRGHGGAGKLRNK